MFRNRSYTFLSAVGATCSALLLTVPAGAGFNGIEISNDPEGSERGGHTVQENIPPKPPVGGEVPDPPNLPFGLSDWRPGDPLSGGWSDGDEWTNLFPPPMLIDLPLGPPSGPIDGQVGPDLSVGLPSTTTFGTTGAVSPIPAPGALSLLGLGALALLGRRRR